MNFDEYVSAFKEAERDFESSVQDFGLCFEESESSQRKQRSITASQCGAHCDNNECSLWRGWISPACIACRTGEKTATFFVDLRCTRNCYFCFNPNQDYYEYFLHHKRDIVSEIREAYNHGLQFDCVAITGGEPLLHADTVVSFIETARMLYPKVHIRLYTSGDLLNKTLMKRLADAGLNEIRFSIKPSDIDKNQNQVYELIGDAVTYIPDVMLEVPVIPGFLEEMKDMLLHVDKLGVRGINLLEMCFPLCNAQAFRERNLKLRKHPFNILYNYWYGGGIPVAQSESESLQLLKYVSDKNLRLGVHYCSSDNKNTGQIYQQDIVFKYNERLQSKFPFLSLDSTDWFLKCAKVFGTDSYDVMEWLKDNGVNNYQFDDTTEALAFPLAYVADLKQKFSFIRIGESYSVIEDNEQGEYSIREITVIEL